MAKPAGQGPQRHITAPKREPIAHRVREGGVGQLGQKQGSHSTDGRETPYRGEKLYGGAGYNNPVGPTNMALSGPGAGRDVHKSGSQDQYGSGGPQKPAGRDILGAFGPESSRRS
jgi:hypothetical protein